MSRGTGWTRFVAAPLLAALAACSTVYRQADGLYRAGDLAGAAPAYDAALRAAPADPAAPRALYRLGVSRATPGTAAFDLVKARRAFQDLVTRYPETPYARQAAVPLALMKELEDAQGRVRALQAELAGAKADADSKAKSARDDLDRSQAQVQLLKSRVAEQELTIERLKREMDQLKHIDLGRSR